MKVARESVVGVTGGEMVGEEGGRRGQTPSGATYPSQPQVCLARRSRPRVSRFRKEKNIQDAQLTWL